MVLEGKMHWAMARIGWGGRRERMMVVVIVVVMVLVMVIVVEWMRLQSSAMGGGSQLCLVTELHLLHLESSAPSLYFWSFGVSL